MNIYDEDILNITDKGFYGKQAPLTGYDKRLMLIKYLKGNRRNCSWIMQNGLNINKAISFIIVLIVSNTLQQSSDR